MIFNIVILHWSTFRDLKVKIWYKDQLIVKAFSVLSSLVFDCPVITTWVITCYYSDYFLIIYCRIHEKEEKEETEWNQRVLFEQHNFLHLNNITLKYCGYIICFRWIIQQRKASEKYLLEMH